MANQRKLVQIMSSTTGGNNGEDVIEIEELYDLKAIAFVDNTLFISSKDTNIIQIKGISYDLCE